MAANKSILDFFKPKQTAVNSAQVGEAAPKATAPEPVTFKAASQIPSTVFKLPEHAAFTPSSSLPTRSVPSSSYQLSSEGNTSLDSNPTNSSAERVIENSDDEDMDSDSSLEDLATLLAMNRSNNQSSQPANAPEPSTPVVSKFKRNVSFHSSPLTVQPKYKFDMKFLVSHAEHDDATEASSKRIKAMLAAQDEEDGDGAMPEDEISSEVAKFAHSELLESVVAEREDGGAHKVSRALKRTEATVTEKRWYFFEAQPAASKSKREPFPTASVPRNWKKELAHPQTRCQTFISGFVEDMVCLGKALPDELFLWMLDELCWEPSGPLRVSYLNTIRQSSEQVRRLMTPGIIQKLFRDLGGSLVSTTVSQKIRPVQQLGEPYAQRDWSNLLSVINMFSRVAESLQQASKTHIICMLLRMSVDQVVFKNIEILDSVQQAINHLCQHTADDVWEATCQEICQTLFETVEQASFRLQLIEVISSISARAHELRRRLALCFYFNDISYSLEPSHSLMDLGRFMERLDDPAFQTTPQTDYRELTALVSLLDIAVDDGRSVKLDLSDGAVEKKFDQDVEALVAIIRNIMRNIGNPGAAFISKIEAKEVLELVSQRIADTVRSKPKPKQTWFDRTLAKPQDDLDAERKGMRSFMAKAKSLGSGNGNGVKSEISK